MSGTTNVDDFIGELNAGLLKQKLAQILSDVAMSTVNFGGKGKKGKVSLVFDFNKVGDNDQVIISCELGFVAQTKRGKKSELDRTDTPMFVGVGGELTIDVPKIADGGQFALADNEKNPSGITQLRNNK